MRHIRQNQWYVTLVVSLVLLSVLLYAAHFAFFKDLDRMLDWAMGSIAFLPVQVLLVTLFMEKLLEQRERSAIIEKLNMVVGAFFDELGNVLLRATRSYDSNADELSRVLQVGDTWTDSAFRNGHRALDRHRYSFSVDPGEWEGIKQMLLARRDFLLRLIENPNLLEHESFTELIRAVFHLTDELSFREDTRALPREDREHLCKDLLRVYEGLCHHWLDYMKHLKHNYPYLFSLAVRTNPFDQKASAIITKRT